MAADTVGRGWVGLMFNNRLSNLITRYKWTMIIGAVVLLWFPTGCSTPDAQTEEDYLVRVGEHVVTVVDFQKAFEIAKTAYPHNLMQKPTAYREAQMRLLNRMTEELILLQRAKDIGLDVTDEEIDQNISEIKSDYPEGEFEQTLLEYAVSYHTWRENIKNRLIMEKLIDKELKAPITITPEDIANYYDENYKGETLKPGVPPSSEQVDENIIEHLRHKKAEAAYRSWIEKIQQGYTIDINQAQWDKIISS